MTLDDLTTELEWGCTTNGIDTYFGDDGVTYYADQDGNLGDFDGYEFELWQ